ncbi:SMP-30/gluconolactonase/LRE family protein [Sphingobacterium sp. HJSM2_6]|uniref:SMP-30/gluconolactonase/LRE family protein n=1 Tax=Sphingobacterium sp. HJSM2_6 TaxID=3366264 RepID=UPI003BC5494B
MHSSIANNIVNSPLTLHGEGPIWHHGRQTVFWVDILSDSFFEYHLESKELIQYPNAKLVSAIFEIKDDPDQLIAIVQGGIAIYNLKNKSYTIISNLGISWDHHRGNDGAVDPDGNIWFSTTHMDHVDGEGDLYRLNAAGSIDLMLNRVSISNGPCWTMDGRLMFHTDSGTRIIKSYIQDDLNLQEAANRIVIEAGFGYPDGMALDTNDVLWVAIWGGFAVAGFDTRDGRLKYQIDLPAPHVSSCAFVGAKLDQLIITTSRKDLSKEDLEKYPQSGEVFLVNMDTSGVPVNAFNKKF